MKSDLASLLPVDVVRSRILLLRGEKVMLDRDLAELYGVETRVLNQAVRRNRTRFPDDFLFTLTREGIGRISQIVTSSDLKFANNVFAFTEQGVAMLSSVLRSTRAVQVNIAIMRAFVQLRRMVASHADLARKLAALERKYDAQFKVVFEAIKALMDESESTIAGHGRRIGFQQVDRVEDPAAPYANGSSSRRATRSRTYRAARSGQRTRVRPGLSRPHPSRTQASSAAR